jgi:hypothetical protein
MWNRPPNQRVVWHSRQCYLGPVLLDNWLTADHYRHLLKTKKQPYLDATNLDTRARSRTRHFSCNAHAACTAIIHATLQSICPSIWCRPYSYVHMLHEGDHSETSVVVHMYLRVSTLANILPQCNIWHVCNLWRHGTLDITVACSSIMRAWGGTVWQWHVSSVTRLYSCLPFSRSCPNVLYIRLVMSEVAGDFHYNLYLILKMFTSSSPNKTQNCWILEHFFIERIPYSSYPVEGRRCYSVSEEVGFPGRQWLDSIPKKHLVLKLTSSGPSESCFEGCQRSKELLLSLRLGGSGGQRYSERRTY